MFDKGLTAKEIGRNLGLSSRTVESYKYSAMERLGVNNFASFVVVVVKNGWLKL